MIDYFEEIENYAKCLSESDIDNAYFGALSKLMANYNQPLNDNLCLPFYSMWQDKRVMRKGRLFFGNSKITSNINSKEFYIYFLSLFHHNLDDNTSNKNNKVFFHVDKLDQHIEKHLLIYRSSYELSLTGNDNEKRFYISQYWDSLFEINNWIQCYKMTAFIMTYQGLSMSIKDWFNLNECHLISDFENINFSDLISIVSGIALNSYFKKIAPHYPMFQTLVEKDNRKRLMENTIKTLVYLAKENSKMSVYDLLDAILILDSLELVNNNCIEIKKSKYVKKIINFLSALHNEKKVIDREYLFDNDGYFICDGFCLEADLLAVLLIVMVCFYNISIIINNIEINFNNINLLLDMPLQVISRFSCIYIKQINIYCCYKQYQNLFDLVDIKSSLNSSKYTIK